MNDFFQEPPVLGNQYHDDRTLRRFLALTVPEEALRDMEPALEHMGELASGELYDLALRHQDDLPELVQYDPWGRRIDEIRISPAWDVMARVACEHGLVAIPYEQAYGPASRLLQFALVYLYSPSALAYACPLAMTDGAVKTLRTLAAPEMCDGIVPRLIERDPERAWTSGQWMTERIGGSDVARTLTVARRTPEGWRLYGTKWFTSAATSEIALTLARPEGNPEGGRGLAMFLVRQRDEKGRCEGIRVLRLKDKLGTRVLPTAELQLEGVLAEPVAGLTDGVRNITHVLNMTRLWNAIDAAATMRRGIALARAYARKRVAFGDLLAEKPLHLETLAELQIEFQCAFFLSFHAAELLGKDEAGELDDGGRAVLRLLLPVAKLVTGRQAVAVSSEVLECFGGAGYIEDTGLPSLLRDAQVLSIWEGTTNVLALDALRAIAREDALLPYLEHATLLSREGSDFGLEDAVSATARWAGEIRGWYEEAQGSPLLESGARSFAMALGRLMQLALLIRQAAWDLRRHEDGANAAAARRLAARGLPALQDARHDRGATRSIALQEPHPAGRGVTA